MVNGEWLFFLEYVGFSRQNVREENFRQKEQHLLKL